MAKKDNDKEKEVPYSKEYQKETQAIKKQYDRRVKQLKQKMFNRERINIQRASQGIYSIARGKDFKQIGKRIFNDVRGRAAQDAFLRSAEYAQIRADYEFQMKQAYQREIERRAVEETIQRESERVERAADREVNRINEKYDQMDEQERQKYGEHEYLRVEKEKEEKEDVAAVNSKEMAPSVSPRVMGRNYPVSREGMNGISTEQASSADVVLAASRNDLKIIHNAQQQAVQSAQQVVERSAGKALWV